MSIVDIGWSEEVTFQDTEMYKSFAVDYSYDLGDDSGFIYVYTGAGYLSGNTYYYSGSGNYGTYRNSTTQSFSLNTYTSDGTGYLTANGSFYMYFHAPQQYANLKTFSFSDGTVTVSKDTPSGEYLFYISFSPNLYSNDASLLSRSDVRTTFLKIIVDNPTSFEYEYYVHFYSDGTEIATSKLSYWTRSGSPPNVLPDPRYISDANNAESLGFSKPGYDAIGWDTSQSAQIVRYGGSGTGSLDIPGGIVPYTNGLFLYSVWKRKDTIQIFIGGTRRYVVDMYVVTSVDSTTHVANTKRIRRGTIYNGSAWKNFWEN